MVADRTAGNSRSIEHKMLCLSEPNFSIVPVYAKAELFFFFFFFFLLMIFCRESFCLSGIFCRESFVFREFSVGNLSIRNVGHLFPGAVVFLASWDIGVEVARWSMPALTS